MVHILDCNHKNMVTGVNCIRIDCQTWSSITWPHMWEDFWWEDRCRSRARSRWIRLVDWLTDSGTWNGFRRTVVLYKESDDLRVVWLSPPSCCSLPLGCNSFWIHLCDPFSGLEWKFCQWPKSSFCQDPRPWSLTIHTAMRRHTVYNILSGTREACWNTEMINRFTQEVLVVPAATAMGGEPVAMVVMGRVLLNIIIPKTPPWIISIAGWLRYKHLHLTPIKWLKRVLRFLAFYWWLPLLEGPLPML